MRAKALSGEPQWSDIAMCEFEAGYTALMVRTGILSCTIVFDQEPLRNNT